MKLGMTKGLNDSFSRWGDLQYTKIKELGFDYVDFQLANTTVAPYTLSDEEAAACLLAQKAAMDAAGITVAQVHGPWRYPPQETTEEECAERMEKMQRSIRFCAQLGCKYWVIHPIMPFGVEELGTELEPETWKRNIAFMRKLLETARAYDVTICLENMPFCRFSISTPEKILEFVKEINDEHFQICLDTGHVSIFDGRSPAEALRLMKDHVKVLHIHDNHGSSDEHLFPYSGVIEWEDFAHALKEINFRGVISLECKPSGKLPDRAYEAMWRAYAEIARVISCELCTEAE